MSSPLLSPALVFLGKMTLISAFLYGYYWFFLRNASFHPYNRWYLLGSVGLSLFLPLLHIPLPAGWMSGDHYTLLLSPDQTASGGGTADPVPASLTGPSSLFYELFRGWKGVYLLYGLVAGFFLFRLGRSLLYLLRLPGKYTCSRVEDIRLFRTQEPGTPFSFFNCLFWNAELPLDTDRGQAIFSHELYHIRQKHTLDILVLAIVRSLFWCNPLFYLFLRELKVVHEFLADRHALSGQGRTTGPQGEGNGWSGQGIRHAYAEWLVWQSVAGARHQEITQSFFHTHLKRRIIMITQSNAARPRFISRITALPILFLLFCAFATKVKPDGLSAARGGKAITGKDSGHLTDLVRFYLHRLRYPATALKEQQEETIWFSVRLGADNQLLEFRHYNATPDLKDKKAWTIKVTSLPSRFPDDKEGKILTQENKKLLFLEEVRRASERIATDTSRVYPAGEYFFTIVFSIEKTAEKASSLEFSIHDNSQGMKPNTP